MISSPRDLLYIQFNILQRQFELSRVSRFTWGITLSSERIRSFSSNVLPSVAVKNALVAHWWRTLKRGLIWWHQASLQKCLWWQVFHAHVPWSQIRTFPASVNGIRARRVELEETSQQTSRSENYANDGKKGKWLQDFVRSPPSCPKTIQGTEIKMINIQSLCRKELTWSLKDLEP